MTFIAGIVVGLIAGIIAAFAYVAHELSEMMRHW